MASQFYARYVPQKKAAAPKRKREDEIPSVAPHDSDSTHKPAEPSTKLPKRPKKKREEKENTEAGLEGAQSEVAESKESLSATKYSSVRSKYEKSGKISERAQRHKATKSRTSEEAENNDVVPEKVYGLEPIPQPEQEEDIPGAPIATLPQWISNPIRSTLSNTISFSSLTLSTATKNALATRGYEKAFAIQSTVLPLLLPGPDQHDGDVCIASGTGTGKTLAFVLPMIEALRNKPVRKLRGLIVVPTRELVAQTRAVFEACASGSGLSVASSEGSKTLSEERKLLVKRVYQPNRAKAKEKREKPINYLTIGDSDEEDPDASTYEILRALPDFVAEFQSKVDVLVCTPGRLVDHLKGTTGFSLEDVEWFAIDEVDRLLNQSYQEWLDYVVPALKKEKDIPQSQLTLMKALFISKKRRVRKIVASATLTTDMSKLVALKLYKPKLVTLQGSTNGSISVDTNDEQNQHFALPETLSEVAMSTKEVSDKPLHLLQILDEFASTSRYNKLDDTDDDDDTSSDGSSTTDSSSEEDTSESEDSSLQSDTTLTDTDSDISGSETKSPSKSSPTPARKSLVVPSSRASDPRPPKGGIVIFTTTNEGAMRLTRLIKLMRPNWSSRVGCLAGTNTSSSRRRTLARLRKGELLAAVTSNLAARGLNIGNLAQVVNYDIPRSLEGYVHRVGRTARAGNNGIATTLLAHHEARWFWKEIGKSTKVQRNSKIVRAPYAEPSEEDRKAYELALGQLGEEARVVIL